MIISLLIGLNLFAIEPVSPKSLCERFVPGTVQENCYKKMKELKPDSYLAAICDQQFDNDAFYNCLELSNLASFEPREIETCANNNLSDQERISCLQTAVHAGKKTAIYQDSRKKERAPASKTLPAKKK